MPVALPGDVLNLPSASSSSSTQHTASASSAIKLGPGLLWPSESAKNSPSPTADRPVLVTKGGIVGAVNSTAGSTAESAAKKGKQGWWIESAGGGSYAPSPSDPVIGQITNRNAEFYTLSISSSHPATLSTLAFEGATKRHKPNLKVGALVYAMVIPSSVEAGGDMEPEITCVDLTTGKGNGMGELETKEGYCGVVEVSLNLAKSLLHPTHTLLQALSNHFAFESAIGLNGLVWLRVTEPAQFLAAKMVLEAADSQWLGQTGLVSSTTTMTHISSPDEKKVGDAGRKLASRWGTLDEKQLRKIVQTCLE